MGALTRVAALGMFACVCLGACGTDPPSAADATPPPDAADDAQVPCEQEGALLGFEGSESHVLHAGDALPVILGFQGFIFVEVGLRSPEPLEEFVVVRSNARLSGGAEVSDTHPGIGTQPGPNGAWDTRKLLVFSNDFPPAELYGREVELALAAPASGCRVRATVRGHLVEGGVQLQDAGVP